MRELSGVLDEQNQRAKANAIPVQMTFYKLAYGLWQARKTRRLNYMCPGIHCRRAGMNRDTWGHFLQFAFPQVRQIEEHTSELQSHLNLVCRLLLEKKNRMNTRGESFTSAAQSTRLARGGQASSTH